MPKKKAEQKLAKNFIDNLFLPAYELSYASRLLDEKMLILLRQGKSYFHIGAMGHEIIQVACGMAMKKGYDFLFPYYRDQALCMSLGQTSYNLLLSFLAKSDDPQTAARQMPMHYSDVDHNIPTSSSSTGTQFLQAVGSALASKILHAEGEEDPLRVTVCTAGDGTTSRGEFYEAISWAAKDKAPVLFLIENNGYAISVNINEQRPGGRIAENFSNFYGLKVYEVDGLDFVSSLNVLFEAMDYIRAGNGPVLIDAKVVRLLPHSSSDDHKKYKSQEELLKEQEQDPVKNLRKLLVEKNIISSQKLKALEKKIKEEIEEASDLAIKAQTPDPKAATDFVWSDKKCLSKTGNFEFEHEQTVMVDAINRALREELSKNKKMLVFGQDVAKGKGGVFTATNGLSNLFKERCFNSPLAEASIVGVAIGLSLRGFKPVPEIQFGDYIWTAMMQIRNELATIRYRSNNSFSSPMVIRVPVGGYIHGGLCHSQNIEATFAHIPGLKIALPSTALDAYGLLKSAIACDDPVLFLEHKALYRQSFARSNLPKGEKNDFSIPFGKGVIRREGENLTVVTYGILVQRALEAAIQLKENYGIEAEVIDLRTIVPYDFFMVYQSVKKTGRLLVLHEDMRFMGFGAEIASDVSENCFTDLDAPVMRLAAKDTPVPYAQELEQAILPQTKDILEKMLELARF